MSTRALVIEVNLLDDRYHGVGDWPPAPWRLFQALVAGAYGGRWAAEEATGKDAALAWLENLSPPHIAAPPGGLGRNTLHYVPNNGLDAKGGDPDRVSELRVPKSFRPLLLTGSPRIVYAWPYDEGEEQAQTVAHLADRLHTLGRGIDPAFARAERLDWSQAEERLRAHGGAIARPDPRPGRSDDPGCPMPGSLDSLKRRHVANRAQYQPGREGRTLTVNFTRPPKPAFRPTAYDRPPTRILCELRNRTGDLVPWPLWRVAELTEAVRDRLAAILTWRLPEDQAAVIERLVIGRGAGPEDLGRRVRLIPLPSIGSPFTDASVRRMVLEVPPDCPLPAGEITAAVVGIDLAMDIETGEIIETAETGEQDETAEADKPVKKTVLAGALVPAKDTGMARHYRIAVNERVIVRVREWYSVTPLALSARPRRRMDPGRLADQSVKVRRREAKPASERQVEEAQARAAVLDAFRQAGHDPRRILSIRVQREPWTAKGEQAERFAPGTRFSRHCLWHVALTLAEPLAGPLVLGDGRFFGLGLMAPVPDRKPAAKADAVLYTLSPEVRPPAGQGAAVTQSIRAALMSLARTPDGGVLPLFSGHLDGSGPARPGDHRHVYLAVLDSDGDGRLDQVQVIAPWRVDRSVAAKDGERRDFARITSDLRIVRAGAAGVLTLSAAQALPVERGTEWVSLTPYRPTRHPAATDDPAAFVADDIRRELSRRQFPQPTAVTVISVTPGPKGGLSARLSLTFTTPVEGPILIGTDAHRGGGMFKPNT